MKRTITIILAVLLLMQIAVGAEGFYSFVKNTEVELPAYEAPVIAEGDMNNPKAPQRYEGVPNPFVTGTGSFGSAEGKFSFHQLSEDNYCTKITVNSATSEMQYPQPYMQHFENSGRSFGKLIFNFDLMRDSTTKILSAAVFMRNVVAGQSGKGTTFVSISETGTLSIVSQQTLVSKGLINEENFAKYEKVPANEWYKIQLIYDIDNGIFDMTINDDEIFSGVTRADLGLTSYSTYYCFRITHRTNKTSGGDAYVDNICIKHDAGFDGVLLKGSSLTKVGTPYAMSRRIGILVDRYNTSVQPFIENNVLYMPLRFTADSMHADVLYNADTADITLKRGERETVLNVNNQTMMIDGSAISLENDLKLINGVTYISVKDITEAIYTNVYYNADGYILITDYSGVTEEALAKLGVHMSKEVE